MSGTNISWSTPCSLENVPQCSLQKKMKKTKVEVWKGGKKREGGKKKTKIKCHHFPKQVNMWLILGTNFAPYINTFKT